MRPLSSQPNQIKFAAVGAAIAARAYGGISPSHDLLVCKGIPLTRFYDVIHISNNTLFSKYVYVRQTTQNTLLMYVQWAFGY